MFIKSTLISPWCSLQLFSSSLTLSDVRIDYKNQQYNENVLKRFNNVFFCKMIDVLNLEYKKLPWHLIYVIVRNEGNKVRKRIKNLLEHF